MKLSEKLRRERIKRGLPSSGVAWMCGMSLAPYSRIENGRREPTLVHAVLFEALFLMEEEGLLDLFALRVKKLRSEMGRNDDYPPCSLIQYLENKWWQGDAMNLLRSYERE